MASYTGAMGMDDANERRGEPGACPGHSWVAGEVLLKPRGAQLTVVCVYCDAIQVEPSKNADFYRDTALEDEALQLVYEEFVKRAEAEGITPADVLLKMGQVFPPDFPGTE